MLGVSVGAHVYFCTLLTERYQIGITQKSIRDTGLHKLAKPIYLNCSYGIDVN